MKSPIPGHLRILTALSLSLLGAAQAADYSYTTNKGTVIITKYIGPGGAVTIPNTIDGLPVTSIGDDAFAGCANVIVVTIPNGVTRIGDWAFSGCASLATVTIPNSVTTIGQRAFYSSGLTSVTIPNTVTNVQEGTFTCCPTLISVTIPHSVTSIGGYAFASCASLAVALRIKEGA